MNHQGLFPEPLRAEPYPRILHHAPAAERMLTHLELLLKGLGQAGYELTAACPVENWCCSG